MKSIRSGESDAALVGGVHINIHPLGSVSFNKLGILSPDGKCKFLDQSADGYVRSETCSVLFLQKASQAKRVYASVVNTGVNNDGHKEMGIIYPSSQMQCSLMRRTLEEANVDPNEVLYVEAHGTATQVGMSRKYSLKY